MKEKDETILRWTNPESPKVIKKECFPPVGITRLLPHHFRLWRRPYYYTWFFWRPVCCCCCCSEEKGTAPAPGCSINLELEKNVFGPGKSIHVLVAPGIYFAEFYLKWSVSGVVGQVKVDLELVSGPVAPHLLADDRGANDHYLFSTNFPGSYLFKATATDAQGNTCFATVQVDVPRI